MTQVNIKVELDELLEEILKSDLNTVAKNILGVILNAVMEEERNKFIGVGDYDRSEERQDYRNGYYDRELTTTVGKIELKVPRTRSGEFSTRIFEKWQRKDKALLLTLTEMVVNGVSTRKVTNIVEELIGESVSKSFVSETMKMIDPEIEAFSTRSLTHTTFDYVSVDAMYTKVREDHRIVSKAIYIAVGIRPDGFREVLGFDVMSEESTENWTFFFRMLKSRGLTNPKLITSDAHIGLQRSIQAEFPGTPWQRCTVHFLRNIIDTMPKKDSVKERHLLRNIFKMTTPQHAREAKQLFLDAVEGNSKFDKSVSVLENGFEHAIQYTMEPTQRQKYVRSTNGIERLNQEVRRRERVSRSFPNVASVYRQAGAVLLDYHEIYQRGDRVLKDY